MSMEAVHRLTAVAQCPTGLQLHDVIEIEVRTDRTIEVERIQETVDDLTKGPVFQEVFTLELARRLGATVLTKCRHDRTVTEVEAGPLARERG